MNATEKRYWVLVFYKNFKSVEFLVHATEAEVFALNTRSAKSYPLERLIAGGWTMSDVKTPEQAIGELYDVKNGAKFKTGEGWVWPAG